jgi:hypothetical protein
VIPNKYISQSPPFYVFTFMQRATLRRPQAPRGGENPQCMDPVIKNEVCTFHIFSQLLTDVETKLGAPCEVWPALCPTGTYILYRHAFAYLQLRQSPGFVLFKRYVLVKCRLSKLYPAGPASDVLYFSHWSRYCLTTTTDGTPIVASKVAVLLLLS